MILKAIVRQIRDGVLIMPGETFHAGESESMDLIRMHYAELIQEAKRPYRRRDMRAEETKDIDL